ncbi:MAG: TIGR03960 family B12-binding radical SAM protein [Proteobacteria bacterium]|nr:TIGR03960 family B12-binding radical SAM protein [Pseudomonadota bacterium]
MNVEQVLHSEILPRVEKPSRYLGTEVNAVQRDWSALEVRLAVAFPDLYDLGLGNLGIHILYACVNKLDWAGCERLYAPAPDMEKALRDRELPLFVLESKDTVDVLDGIGFTLQSELTYTNILNMLDLSSIPLRTKDRDDSHPIVFAGGPAVFNPEPVAPFIDFFLIGDGEDAIIEIAEVFRKTKGQGRAAILTEMAKLEGVYVPALYPFITHPDGRVLPDPSAPKVRKRITRDLNGATFPTDYIVPYTQQVHDRISLEVLRGCTQGCRFCQAGMVTRPVRERKLENVDELLKKSLATTGYEEVSLVSLSTCDYSRVKQLVANTVEVARPQNVAVSLPSLRLDSYSVELSDMVAETRKTGVTFAPEAASPRLRAVINKWIPDDDLLDMSAQVYKRGWDHVKLYFMIGLPTERDDDVEAIADLAIRTQRQGRGHNDRARVNMGVSTFVPKPFTPFQWAQQLDIPEIERRQDLIANKLYKKGAIKFGRHEPQETFLEGLVTRADRRGGDLIEAAWRNGARFDAWREHLDVAAWMKAIDDIGYDVKDALRERSVYERLPWDHIDIMIDKEWFVADWQRAMELKWAQDCRHRRCHACGVIDQERELCASMMRNSHQGRKEEKDWVRPELPSADPGEPVQRLWFRIARTGPARFLSHLEAMNAWIRSLRRVGAPLAYSQGFHPHPKIAFSSATPSGQETVGDYMDITLKERLDAAELLSTLRETLPEGFDVLAVTEVERKAPSLMGLNDGGDYTLFFEGVDRDALKDRLDALLAEGELLVSRRSKTRKSSKTRGRYRRRTPVQIEVDIRPMVVTASLRPGELAAIDLRVKTVDGKPPKAKEFAALLSEDPASVRVLRRDTLDPSGKPLSTGWVDGAVLPKDARL